MSNVDRLTDIELLSRVIVTSSSVRLLHKTAVASRDMNQAANRAKPSLLRFLARQGRQTAETVIEDIVQSNPGTQRPDRPTFVDDPNNDRYGHILNWNMSNLELEYLPESLCKLLICGNLNLSKNKLRALPINFGNLVVRGYLDLSTNFLERLPDSFWKCQIGGDLRLHENDFMYKDSLPESFGESLSVAACPCATPG
jgi:hypothetical protein